MVNYQIIIDFIRQQYNTEEFIPLHVPIFSGREREYVLDTIDSTYVSSVGGYVNRFEEMMQEITNTKRAVALVNGTAALQVALRLAGVVAGDLVVTQALTFVATANAIVYNQAQPYFLDVDLDTMGMSPTALKEFFEEQCERRNDECFHRSTGKRISACVPMHTFGFPCRIEEIVAVCEQWHIPVVEDAAESLGSTRNGKPTGSFGKLGVFSFNGNKIVTSGGGGIIVTCDEQMGEYAKHLTTTAKKPHKWEYYHDDLGYNFRMPNLNAALACAQLEQLDGFIEQKRKMAKVYESFFLKHGINFRTERSGARANYWLMTIELESRQDRDQFLDESNKQGVMTRPIWQLMYRLPHFKNTMRDEQKNAQYLEDRIVNIPSSVKR